MKEKDGPELREWHELISVGATLDVTPRLRWLEPSTQNKEQGQMLPIAAVALLGLAVLALAVLALIQFLTLSVYIQETVSFAAETAVRPDERPLAGQGWQVDVGASVALAEQLVGEAVAAEPQLQLVSQAVQILNPVNGECLSFAGESVCHRVPSARVEAVVTVRVFGVALDMRRVGVGSADTLLGGSDGDGSGGSVVTPTAVGLPTIILTPTGTTPPTATNAPPATSTPNVGATVEPPSCEEC